MKKLISLILSVLMLASTAQADAPQNYNIWERATLGKQPGMTFVELNGYNGAITTTAEPLWPESAAYTVPSAALSTPYCASSDNTADVAAGTGARTITVSGVNTSYAAFTETVTMNGQTSVNLTTTNVLFINSLTLATAGSGATNAGTIRCGTGTNTAGVPAVVHAHMPIGYGSSQSVMYAVPSGYNLLCHDWSVSSYGVTAAQTVQFYLDIWQTPAASAPDRLYKRYQIGQLNQAGASAFNYTDHVVIPQKSIAIVQALSAASTGPVWAHAECLLVSASGTNMQYIF